MNSRKVVHISRSDAAKWAPQDTSLTDWLKRKAEVALSEDMDIEFEIDNSTAVLLRLETARYASVGVVTHYTVLLHSGMENTVDREIDFVLFYDTSHTVDAIAAFSLVSIIGTRQDLLKVSFLNATDIQSLAEKQKERK